MSRILTLQRQLRELGRLRTGYSDGRRPVRSDTWIVTSHSEEYVRAAADIWGGTPEKWSPQGNGADQWRAITNVKALDAILPPGDPLSQANELWSGGGCQRRCDGQTEMLSDSPCMCLAQFGDAWHEEKKGDVCSITTRLNVLLPEMPDFGVWRVETHGYYSANEIAATVDVIRGATPGMVPVRLRIEQRTRTARGQTRHFPVVALELRGATTQQVLSGSGITLAAIGQPAPVAAIAGATGGTAGAQPAIGQAVAHGPDYWMSEVSQALGREELQEVWGRAKVANENSTGLRDAIAKRLEDFPAEPAVVEQTTAVEHTVDDLWPAVMRMGPETLTELEADFLAVTGVGADDATAEHMQTYLDSKAAA